jgi:hypothetical protein
MMASWRMAAAVAFTSIVASSAWASSDQNPALNLSDHTQACAIPTATGSSAYTQDSAVQQVGDNEPASCNASTCEASCGAEQNCGCGGSSCNCCGDECSPYACCCLPLWYVDAGAVILRRDRPNDGITVGNNPFTGAAFSRGSDFSFGSNAGPDITIGRRLGEDSDTFLEGRYFNSYGSANLDFRTPGGFIGAGFTGPANTLFEGQDLTKLDSSEINFKHQWDHLALLAGFRWIELKDDATYTLNRTVAYGEYNYNNHLYGGQLGFDWDPCDRCNRLQLHVIGKAGIYGNADDGGIFEFQGANRTPIGSFLGQGSSTAFVGELDFTASYAFTKHIAVRGGYELLWLTDLALATDAASRSLLNPSLLRTVDDSANLFYQGALVGLDFTW